MTVIEATDDATRGRSRPRQLVALLAVVALVAGAAVAIVLLRGRHQEPFAGQRTSMTGRELRASLGRAVATEHTGRVQMAITDETTMTRTIDFEVGGAEVDAVVDDEQGRIVVLKRGVIATRGVSDVVSLAELRRRKGPLELEGLPLLFAESLKSMTFQAKDSRWTGDDAEEIPPDALYTRVSASDDGRSVWTATWLSAGTSLRRDSRVVVDAAGLPVELRLVEAKEAESTRPATVKVLTYSGWGQPVQVPEPTPFGGGIDLEVTPGPPATPSPYVSPTS